MMQQRHYYPIGFSDPDHFTNMFEGFQTTLNHLMKGINSISNELVNIRELIVKNNGGGSVSKHKRIPSGRGIPGSREKKRELDHGQQQPVISLDFDEYIEKRKEPPKIL